MNNKKLIGVGLLSVLGLIGVVLLVYAAVINGTSGNDTLRGTAGSDIINGLAGNDQIYRR
jgi:Ca2+-binding RTX toxin-like protein